MRLKAIIHGARMEYKVFLAMIKTITKLNSCKADQRQKYIIQETAQKRDQFLHSLPSYVVIPIGPANNYIWRK